MPDKIEAGQFLRSRVSGQIYFVYNDTPNGWFNIFPAIDRDRTMGGLFVKYSIKDYEAIPDPRTLLHKAIAEKYNDG